MPAGPRIRRQSGLDGVNQPSSPLTRGLLSSSIVVLSARNNDHLMLSSLFRGALEDFLVSFKSDSQALQPSDSLTVAPILRLSAPPPKSLLATTDGYAPKDEPSFVMMCSSCGRRAKATTRKKENICSLDSLWAPFVSGEKRIFLRATTCARRQSFPFLSTPKLADRPEADHAIINEDCVLIAVGFRRESKDQLGCLCCP